MPFTVSAVDGKALQCEPDPGSQNAVINAGALDVRLADKRHYEMK
jgi:hypothetical protein